MNLYRWHTIQDTILARTIYTHAREYISSTKLEQLIPRLEKCCISVRSQWSLHICCIPTMTEFETILHKLSFAKIRQIDRIQNITKETTKTLS